MQVSMTVNGVTRTDEVEPRMLLAHHLRDGCGLRATNIGCDTTSCGACTVLVDGESVKSCTVLAVQADGASVTTLEGLADTSDAGADGLHPVQAAFRAEHGLQCGFCTPGMDGGGRAARGEPAPDRGRGARRARGEPVPLHRLPQHRACGARRGLGR
jgi:aerobic carbon-monoxide dehydrogenase small subunit